MSVLAPIKRILGVPDLVENVFLRLDAASRRAFFQAHPDIAQNGLVLAHAHLRIELSPGSLEDQWQRVLRLTRSQPVRCLILSGPNKGQLHDFLNLVPHGKHGEKQRVLQGTELHFEIHVKMETGGIQCLRAMLRRWRDEQQTGAEGDAREQLVVDLCGRELIATSKDDLEPPSCTLKNGTLQLPGTCRMRVSRDRVGLMSIVLKGTGTQKECVEVPSGSTLVMDGCHVEGGLFGAVRLDGAGASLRAQRCSIRSEGNGLEVHEGGKASLEHVTASCCGKHGVLVDDDGWEIYGSEVRADHCSFDWNGLSNVSAHFGGSAFLRHCSGNSSRGNGFEAVYLNSRLSLSDCSASNNKGSGVRCDDLAGCNLSHVTASGNGSHGLHVTDISVLRVYDSSASSNRECGVKCDGRSRLSLSRFAASGNGLHGCEVSHWDSSMSACDSRTSSNKECGVYVHDCARASLSRTDASKNLVGICGWGVQSSVGVCDSRANANKWSGVAVLHSSHASLSHITASENGMQGCVTSQRSILLVSDSSASKNKWSGVACARGGSASLSMCTASNNGEAGLHADGPGSTLAAKSCQVTGNRLANVREASGGYIFCEDAK